MKLEQVVHGHSFAVNEKLLAQYRSLTEAGVTFSLSDLLSTGRFRIDRYADDFAPHPFAVNLKRAAREFCEGFDIWLPGSEYYLTCAIYLFPNAPICRILPIVKNNAVDFYLNDVMGREIFPHLSKEEQASCSIIRTRMSNLAESVQPWALKHPVEFANLEALREMEYLSPSSWFAAFTELFCYHIMLAHNDCNSAGTGHILEVDGYIQQRAHISGMPHTVKLIEFSSGAFINNEELLRVGLRPDFERLNWVISLIGCLMNDLFSFEKEVIDNRSDSNLVSILMLNNYGKDLESSLLDACAIVRNLLEEYDQIVARIIAVMTNPGFELALSEKLELYLLGAKRCVQACWKWQVFTPRYKRENSIWQETSKSIQRTV